MAKKILKAGGKLLGIGKKKAATAAPVAEQAGPIIKALGGSSPEQRRRNRLARLAPTLLSDTLGG